MSPRPRPRSVSNTGSAPHPNILPRKGGGGGGGHGGGGGGHASSGGKGTTGGSSSVSKGSVSVPFSGKTYSASSASRGGGIPSVIPTGQPFAGRQFGGATRDQVYGTSRIGSGYPYGGYGGFYGGRPFPYGFYPLFITTGYYGGDEYGPGVDATRPGGALSTAVVQPANNASAENTFYIFGDASSVSAVLSALVTQCGITNTTVIRTYPNDTSSHNGTLPLPEQVVQYYRASSFALALSTYNNSAALPAHAPASNSSAPPPLSEDTPVMSTPGQNVMLLACLNATIAMSLPLLDGPTKKHFDAMEIIAIIFASFAGLLMLYMLWACCKWRCTQPRKPQGVC